MAKVTILPFLTLFVFFTISATAQEATLPPLMKWSGKSEQLIAPSSSKWQTPAEASGFKQTPDYAATNAWFQSLADTSALVSTRNIGKSAGGDSIMLVLVSRERAFHQSGKSEKPLLLAQCGIHAGEIDGKDASMMLLRDMVRGDKIHLLDSVNLMIIPILNVDGHRRSGPYNRMNQRGPENMGWRTNSHNLNLNRDYAKLDTDELRSVLAVIQEFQPDLYFDIHVTDGADYQYDVTYGFVEKGYSPAIGAWLANRFRPFVDQELQKMGHIPGPLLFAMNGDDFSEGNMDYMFSPDFSHAYGDLRHLPTILIENHSLKPFRQRVLGTYVFLEAAMKLLAREYDGLSSAVQTDQQQRADSVALGWTFPGTEKSLYFGQGDRNKPQLTTQDSMRFLGIKSKKVHSDITGGDYVQWLAEPYQQTIPVYSNNQPYQWVDRPVAYYIPPAYSDIIDRLNAHGIVMDTLTAATSQEVEVYRVTQHEFAKTAFEGHIKVNGTTELSTEKRQLPLGTVRVRTNQPLGDLAIYLLEPLAGSSLFQWGMMKEIFSRTEYIEPYVMVPYLQKMLQSQPALKEAFERKKSQDPEFAKDPGAIQAWFYQQTPFYDQQYLVYPIFRAVNE